MSLKKKGSSVGFSPVGESSPHRLSEFAPVTAVWIWHTAKLGTTKHSGIHRMSIGRVASVKSDRHGGTSSLAFKPGGMGKGAPGSHLSGGRGPEHGPHSASHNGCKFVKKKAATLHRHHFKSLNCNAPLCQPGGQTSS